MPLKLNINIGENRFEAEGDVNVDEQFVSLFRTWINAQGLGDATTVEDLAKKLEDNNAALAAAVATNTPPSPTT